MSRRRPSTYAVAVVVALIASYGAGKAYVDAQHNGQLAAELKHAVQSPTHGHDIAIWCDAINRGRDYERQYQHATVQQSESEANTIERAIAKPDAHGLTPTQAAFIRLYLSSVVALEREAPQTLSLHPFTLGDLDCKQIEAGEAASTHTKR